MEEYGTMVPEDDGPRGLTGVEFTARDLEAHRDGMGSGERAISRRICTLNTARSMPVIGTEERPRESCVGPSLESLRPHPRDGEGNTGESKHTTVFWSCTIPLRLIACGSAVVIDHPLRRSHVRKNRREDQRSLRLFGKRLLTRQHP